MAKGDNTVEQKLRDLLEEMGVDNAQYFSAGDLVGLANYAAGAKPVEVVRLTPEEAQFKLAMKAMLLQKDLNVEIQRSKMWRELANKYDDMRGWLRLSPDNQEGHSEFYKQCCLLIFGEYRGEGYDDE